MRQLNLKNIPPLPFEVSEALTQFRLNLGFCGSEIKTVMLTSSTPNEGKSFLTLQLWKMMAELGIPVLLVDADFRNSVLRAKYSITATDGEKLVGGAAYLSGRAHMEDVIYHTNISCGDIMPVVSTVANPAMMLHSPRFAQMLQEASEKYEYILIDTPPLGSVSDALAIAPICDGTVLIVRSGTTPRKLVNDSVIALQRTGTPLLGFVLNRVSTEDGSNPYYRRYYHGGYHYYYSRYSQYGKGHGYGNHYKRSHYGYGNNKQPAQTGEEALQKAAAGDKTQTEPAGDTENRKEKQ